MRFLGIDMSAMFRRHYEACEKDAAKARERTVADVVAMREGFDRVALCLDGGRSFRVVFEPNYKAQRERPPAAFYEQQTRTIDRLVADGCVALKAPQVDMAHAGGPPDGLFAEGDDVIAALAQWCVDNSHTLRIVGSDKDLLQLVDDERGIEVVRPGVAVPLLPGQTEPERVWHAAHVVAKIGVTPEKIADWLALAGDGTDNFKPFPGWTEPGVNGANGTAKPGIGDVTAVKLIDRFGSALAVADASLMSGDDGAPLIKGHVGDVLRRGSPSPVDAASRGLNLAKLHWTLAIDFSPLLAEPITRPITQGDAFDGSDTFGPPPPASAPRTIEPAIAEASFEPPRASTALARADTSQAITGGVDRLAYQPRDLEQLWRISKAFHDSRLYPQYGTREAIMVIAFVDDLRAKVESSDDPNCIIGFALHASAAFALPPFDAPEIGFRST